MTIYEPALYKHSVTLYEAMKDQAEEVDEGMYVWSGGLTHLTNEVIGHGYYSDVVRALKSMECIVQKRRGAGKVPSEWWLTNEPTLELFHNRVGSTNTNEYKSQQKINDLTARINQLESRVRGLEAVVGE